jgi:hypothetical protein
MSTGLREGRVNQSTRMGRAQSVSVEGEDVVALGDHIRFLIEYYR